MRCAQPLDSSDDLLAAGLWEQSARSLHDAAVRRFTGSQIHSVTARVAGGAGNSEAQGARCGSSKNEAR